jgi:hypothetical protein
MGRTYNPRTVAVRRAIKRAQESMRIFGSAVRPIYGVDRRDRPDALGSGVLLYAGGRHLLLTAAHVLDLMETQEVYIGGQRDILSLPKEWHHSVPPVGGTRNNDRLDIAFMELPRSVVKEMGQCLWLSPDDLLATGRPPAVGPYCAIGYPVRRARVQPATLQVRQPGDIYVDTSIHKPEVYARLRAATETHIVLHYDRERVVSRHGVRVPTVKPYGMSGGGLWRLDSLVLPVIAARRNPLAGILTEWHREEKVMLATRTEVYVEALRRTFPELL